jgi:sporulation protein YlmC with PRC-barrel domain
MVHDVFAWPGVQLGEDKVVVRGSPIAQEAPETQSLAKMLQAPLKDAEGKSAGQIQDLMVGFDDAHVASFVLHFDPKWLDMAAPAAVPLTSLARNDDGFLVKFKSSDVRPAGQKAPPAPPPPPPVHLARLTQVANAAPNFEAARRLLAARFINFSGEVVGETKDVVVDMADGKPEFVVASFKSDWVAPGWLVILPVRPVAPDKEGQPAMRAQLNDINYAYLFESKSWPDFSNPAVRAAVHAKIDHL